MHLPETELLPLAAPYGNPATLPARMPAVVVHPASEKHNGRSHRQNPDAAVPKQKRAADTLQLNQSAKGQEWQSNTLPAKSGSLPDSDVSAEFPETPLNGERCAANGRWEYRFPLDSIDTFPKQDCKKMLFQHLL